METTAIIALLTINILLILSLVYIIIKMIGLIEKLNKLGKAETLGEYESLSIQKMDDTEKKYENVADLSSEDILGLDMDFTK